MRIASDASSKQGGGRSGNASWPLTAAVARRRATTTLLAAVDVAGTVIETCMGRHRSRELHVVLEEVESAVPADLDIDIVMDNASSHNTRQFRCGGMPFVPGFRRWVRINDERSELQDHPEP